ncbi:MAG: C-GCAxxG-C-C family protein [Clostridiales bacterium]|nr:C-GCAxxG-C-C family protein [Clostridiales bacterium]
MSELLDRSKALRGDPNVHYNCAQSVLIPFAEHKGMDTATATALSANFGAGMKMASVCGAVTGGLMALGLYGVDDGPTVSRYYKLIKDNHDGMLLCQDLLAAYKRQGGKDKKPHCDGLVYECVQAVEDILTERGLL